MSESKTPPTASFHDERNDMAYWFPKLNLIDVPTPTSYQLPLDRSGEGPPEWDTDEAVEIVERLGGEAFVRSGYKSASYDPKGGYISDATPETVELSLLELGSSLTMMQMPFGETLWLREWLDINFCAYCSDPLVPEVRAFIRDGEVVCHHPRLEGFEEYPEHRDVAEDYIESGWGGVARDVSVEEYAQRVADAFDGWWSVDFIMTVDGEWYCTDMALDALYPGETRNREGWCNISGHASGCECNLEEQYSDPEAPNQ